MHDLSCVIKFPYNWNREFYCGEQLQVSVELRCATVVVVKGVELRISCWNTENDANHQYGQYINDQDDGQLIRKGVHDFKSDIDLLGNCADQPVRLQTGTHIFNLNCWLPERISDQKNSEGQDELCFDLSVRIRKNSKMDKVHPLEMNHPKGIRKSSFTWPGNHEHICHYSNVAVDISSFHVLNLDCTNNRFSHAGADSDNNFQDRSQHLNEDDWRSSEEDWDD